MNGQSPATKAQVASRLHVALDQTYPDRVCEGALSGIKAGRIDQADLDGLLYGLPSGAVVALFNPLARDHARPLPLTRDQARSLPAALDEVRPSPSDPD